MVKKVLTTVATVLTGAAGFLAWRRYKRDESGAKSTTDVDADAAASGPQPTTSAGSDKPYDDEVPEDQAPETDVYDELFGDRRLPGQGQPQLALIAGSRSDPEVEAALSEMQDYLTSHGVKNYVTAAEFCTLPKGKPVVKGKRPVAVPPRNLWPNTVQTLLVFDKIREEWGRPITIRGYRPRDYNKAVGGSKRSIHQWAGAVDCKIQNYTRPEREQFALLVASFVIDNPDEKMGFGVYSEGMPVKTVHFDTGWQQRSWEDRIRFCSQSSRVCVLWVLVIAFIYEIPHHYLCYLWRSRTCEPRRNRAWKGRSSNFWKVHERGRRAFTREQKVPPGHRLFCRCPRRRGA